MTAVRQRLAKLRELMAKAGVAPRFSAPAEGSETPEQKAAREKVEADARKPKLTDEEKTVCARLGLKEEEYALQLAAARKAEGSLKLGAPPA